MTLPLSLETRRLELQRRLDALPKEVEEWVTRTQQQIDYNSHYSQIQALKIMMDTMLARQKKLLEKLSLIKETADFERTLFSLIIEIIKVQQIWDFFRDKLELRFSPNFKDPLAIADTVAWDCYRPTLNKAQEFGIISQDRFREPPLTYLTAEFSPATWVRGSRPADGRDYLNGTVVLPIPVIEIPWDHVVNVWEFLSLPHEVGHDIEADLGLRPVFQNSLAQQLRQNGVPEPRVRIWVSWEAEIVADLIGLLLAGPAFAYYMVNLLTLSPEAVTTYNDNDPHPSHYIRIFINTAFIKTLLIGDSTLVEDAKHLDDLWTQLYGNLTQLGNHKVADFKSDFDIVFKALIDTKFDALQKHSVREIIPFTNQDNATIRAAVEFLVTGQNRPSNIRPRHVISASRLAVDRIMLQADNQSTKLIELNTRTTELVKANTPQGLRAAEDSQKHRAFIVSLAEAI
jgi:hypothetical protein